jgi:AbrB family looped-hinge helix DNA binding protein
MALAHSKVTAQGQISVPIDVRRKLGIGPGSILEWDEDGDRIVVRRSGRYTSEDIHRAVFPGQAPKSRSVDDMKEGIRRRVRGSHARRWHQRLSSLDYPRWWTPSSFCRYLRGEGGLGIGPRAREATWVLAAVYDRSAADLVTAVEMLLNHKDLTLQDFDVVAGALDLFRSRPALGFSDCLMLQLARKAGHLPLGTFDRALGKIAGTQKL